MSEASKSGPQGAAARVKQEPAVHAQWNDRSDVLESAPKSRPPPTEAIDTDWGDASDGEADAGEGSEQDAHDYGVREKPTRASISEQLAPEDTGGAVAKSEAAPAVPVAREDTPSPRQESAPAPPATGPG